MFDRLFKRIENSIPTQQSPQVKHGNELEGKFLGMELVADDYANMLADDLENAIILRFCVAYVSIPGLNRIGPERLAKALSKDGSFGVASLSCSTGYRPLLSLQNASGTLPLKYFMDPLIKRNKHSGEPEDIALMHSKLVYMKTLSDDPTKSGYRSIVYLGSHNWTSRALGGCGIRNGEASYRFEQPFDDSHLSLVRNNFFGEVNAHLNAAYNCRACLDVDAKHEPVFEQWYSRGCEKSKESTKDRVIRLSAILKNEDDVVDYDWNSLKSAGIYLQSLVEREGRKIWDHRTLTIVVQLWRSVDSVAKAEQPLILICKETTGNASPDSTIKGNNVAEEVLDGFAAVLFDTNNANDSEHDSTSTGARTSHDSYMDYFWFRTAEPDETSKSIDDRKRPFYQFNIQVTDIVFPESGTFFCNNNTDGMQWRRNTLAFVGAKDGAKYERASGYFLPSQEVESIKKELKEQFGATEKNAKVLPLDERSNEKHRIGKRAAMHIVHDAYIPKQSKEDEIQFFEESPEEVIVPSFSDKRKKHISRIEILYTARFTDLKNAWLCKENKRGKRGAND